MLPPSFKFLATPLPALIIGEENLFIGFAPPFPHFRNASAIAGSRPTQLRLLITKRLCFHNANCVDCAYVQLHNTHKGVLRAGRWVRASPSPTNAQNFRGVKLIYDLLNVQPALLRHYKYRMSKLVLGWRFI